MTMDEIFERLRTDAADRLRESATESCVLYVVADGAGSPSVARHAIPEEWMRDDRSKDALCALLTLMFDGADAVLDGYAFVSECWVSTRPIDQPDDDISVRPSADPRRTEALVAVCETRTRSELWFLELRRDDAKHIQPGGDWVRIDLGCSRFAYMLCPPPARS